MSDYDDAPKLVGRGMRRADETDDEEKMDVEEGNSDKERNEKQTKVAQDSDEDADGKPKRVMKPRPRFTEDHLIGSKGLEKIYLEFPTNCPFQGAGTEAEDLRKAVKHYMEWAYQLFPGLAFEDVLDRVQKLTAKAQVRRTIEELRQKENTRYLQEKFGDDYEEYASRGFKAQAKKDKKKKKKHRVYSSSPSPSPPSSPGRAESESAEMDMAEPDNGEPQPHQSDEEAEL